MPRGFSRAVLYQITSLVIGCVLAVVAGTMHAIAAPAPENPQSGSVGLEGTLPADPPSQGATIVVPSAGQSFSGLPIRVSGLCPDGLLVKVFANEIFVGSTICENGSYEIEAGIFGGQNQLVARVYDALEQPGPDSNRVSVTLNDAQFNAIGAVPLSLTSDYARRGADPNEQLTWPFILSGGRAPYAVSVDSGDGSQPHLMSVDAPGVFEVAHTYEEAGVYRVTVRATDADDQVAFLQVVGVANGHPAPADEAENVQSRIDIIWWPAAFTLVFIFVAFWLGRRYQVQELRKKLEQHKG